MNKAELKKYTITIIYKSGGICLYEEYSAISKRTALAEIINQSSIVEPIITITIIEVE